MARSHLLLILFLLTARCAPDPIPSTPVASMNPDIQRNNTENSIGMRLLGNETLVRSSSGQHCNYDCFDYRCGSSVCRYCSGRSEYCGNGCCGSVYSSRNDVCCKDSGPSDTSTTLGLILGLILCLGTPSILLL